MRKRTLWEPWIWTSSLNNHKNASLLLEKTKMVRTILL